MYTTHNAKFGKYKIIVAGTRTYGVEPVTNRIIESCYKFFKDKMDFYLAGLPKEVIEIVSGCAPGPDTMAIRYAEEKGYKLWRFPPDWKTYGKTAGIVRNTLMADFSTHLIAFWDGQSKGTADMVKQAKEHDIQVRIIRVKVDPDNQPQKCEGMDA